MEHASSEPIPCTSSGIGLCMRTLVRRDSRRIWGGWSNDFCRLILLWKEHVCSRVQAYHWLSAYGSTDLISSRGLLMGYYACGAVPMRTFFSWENADLTGARSPITLPMTVGLGGSMLVALNALTSIATTGGGATLLCSTPVFVIDGRRLSSPWSFARPCFLIRGRGQHCTGGQARVSTNSCLH